MGQSSEHNFRRRGKDALASAAVETGPDFATAQRAGEWVRQFYPDIAVTLDREAAQLVSDERDEAELTLIWRSALANERLLAEGAAPRAAVIDALVR